MLAVLEQNPDIAWHQLLENTDIKPEQVSDMPEIEANTDNDLARKSFIEKFLSSIKSKMYSNR